MEITAETQALNPNWRTGAELSVSVWPSVSSEQTDTNIRQMALPIAYGSGHESAFFLHNYVVHVE